MAFSTPRNTLKCFPEILTKRGKNKEGKRKRGEGGEKKGKTGEKRKKRERRWKKKGKKGGKGKKWGKENLGKRGEMEIKMRKR